MTTMEKTHATGVYQQWDTDLNGNAKALWVVPDVPPSLNKWERMHWAQRNQIKKSWEEFVWLFQRQHSIPRDCDWVYSSAVIVFRKNAHRDLSNYDSTFWKIFPDVLQRVGILKDDTELQMKRGPVSFRIDPSLGGHLRDRLQIGCTKIAVIAHPKETLFRS